MLNKQPDNMTIRNNHVIYLDQRDHENLLSLQAKFRVHINKFLRNGNGGITITCLLDPFKPLNNSFYARIPVSEEYVDKEGRRALEDFGLRIVKVEKLENIALQQLFNKNEQRVKDKPKRLYQCVSAQFCDLICRVGFQKEFAPPAEQRYGSGIYFSSIVDGALKLWKEQDHEQYIYIIQARVLTGKSTDGSRDFVLPPAFVLIACLTGDRHMSSSAVNKLFLKV